MEQTGTKRTKVYAIIIDGVISDIYLDKHEAHSSAEWFAKGLSKEIDIQVIAYFLEPVVKETEK